MKKKNVSALVIIIGAVGDSNSVSGARIAEMKIAVFSKRNYAAWLLRFKAKHGSK